MNKDETTVLQLLKKELEFLESGGYKHAPRSPWRPAYIFEESPSCPNFHDKARPHVCEDCWLMEFVRSGRREEQVPCRFVELSSNGVTVDSLYRCGTPAETEEELRNWLHQRIRELECQIDATQSLAGKSDGLSERAQ
jgi:hypothetical protein